MGFLDKLLGRTKKAPAADTTTTSPPVTPAPTPEQDHPHDESDHGHDQGGAQDHQH